MMAGFGVHRQAVQRVFGEDHEVHGRQVAPRLGHHGDDPPGLRAQVGGRGHHRQLELHEADHHPVRALVQAAESVHRVDLT
jgi:hypothetical protein